MCVRARVRKQFFYVKSIWISILLAYSIDELRSIRNEFVEEVWEEEG